VCAQRRRFVFEKEKKQLRADDERRRATGKGGDKRERRRTETRERGDREDWDDRIGRGGVRGVRDDTAVASILPSPHSVDEGEATTLADTRRQM